MYECKIGMGVGRFCAIKQLLFPYVVYMHKKQLLFKWPVLHTVVVSAHTSPVKRAAHRSSQRRGNVH